VKNAHFLFKKCTFLKKKSVTKLLCVKAVSRKVVWYSLAYLSVQKWLGNVPLMNIWPKITPSEMLILDECFLVATQQ